MVYFQEINLTFKNEQIGGEDKKLIHVVANNFSINLLDQSEWVDEIYNPISLVPGITISQGKK